MTSNPSGTVTFLFTDMENSTRMAREHPETWEDTRARHHDILREAIECYQGYVFQIIGDAFCAAFHKAADALNAAIKAQRGLQNESWGELVIRVRMGIHPGKAEAHGGEYHGYLTLSLVQRLMSAGHGGQILLSDATEKLLREELHLPKQKNRPLGSGLFSQSNDCLFPSDRTRLPIIPRQKFKIKHVDDPIIVQIRFSGSCFVIVHPNR